MQPKASVVIPCYNKAKYIDRMFESLLAQKWDNIEVILSIRHSNDGTDEKIFEWIPKLIARGFSVVCIYGENESLSTGVLSGLKRCTGNYVLQINADDWISDNYISVPIEYMESHPECQYTIGELQFCDGQTEERCIFWRFKEETDRLTIEDYVFFVIPVCSNVLVVRKSYFDKVGILERFYTGHEATQEPQMFLPLIYGGGKFKHFSELKYYFDTNQNGDQISKPDDLDVYIKFKFGYADGVRAVLAAICKDTKECAHNLMLNEVITLIHILIFAVGTRLDINDERIQEYGNRLRGLLIRKFRLRNDTSIADLLTIIHHLQKFLIDRLAGNKFETIITCRSSKIIICGALGKNGARILPKLLKSLDKSKILLWDASATGKEFYNGISVSKPDYDSIRPDDVAVVLVAKKNYRDEIVKELKKAGCQNIYDYSQVVNTFCQSLFYDTW